MVKFSHIKWKYDRIREINHKSNYNKFVHLSRSRELWWGNYLMEEKKPSLVDNILRIIAIGFLVSFFLFLILSIVNWNFMKLWFLMFNVILIYIMLMMFFNKRMNERMIESFGKMRFIGLNIALLGVNILIGFFNFMNFINWNLSFNPFLIVIIIVIVIFVIAFFFLIYEDLFMGDEGEEIHIIKDRKK